MPTLPQRSTGALALGFSLALALALALPATGTAQGGSQVQLVQLIANGGLAAPVGATHAGDGSGRLFIVEQVGRIRVWNGTSLLPTPFLSLSVGPGCSTTSCGERGLLGLAFHPNYASNGFFYVYYTRPGTTGAEAGDIQIARYHVSGDPNVADPSSGLVLLTIEHSSQSNHNGGDLVFGPDGYLYAGTGDGGGGGDPFENGQNKDALLAKLLRLDVDGDDFPADPNRNYRIPASNPFAGATAGADEVWAYGLRNPWRFSFDRTTGDLYIGDVGQNLWEEVNFQPASSGGGENYGWDCREGLHAYNDTNGDNNVNCGPVVSVDPILELDHSPECSVTGGYVYRGGAGSSLLSGNYIFSDYCSGKIWRAIPAGGGAWTFNYNTPLPTAATFGLTSFSEGESGRLYVSYANGSFHWLSPYTFSDVPPTNPYWPFVEAIFGAGITTGCSTAMPPSYCADSDVSRAQMAVFLLRAEHGPLYFPPAATGTVFADVPAGSFAADWIEQLFAEGITSGCATNPQRFCPSQSIRRSEMAVFLLRAKHGTSYTPPPATGTVFADVPADSFAAAWIEQLYAEGITSGCATSPLRFCPTLSVQRAPMAVFLSTTFELPLP